MKQSYLAMFLAAVTATAQADELPTIHAKLTTAALHNYEDAPATPDADDPAIWVNPRDPRQALVIATAKDAGLLVYNKSGALVQALFPPNAPRVTAADPATPAGLNPAQSAACEGSDGSTYGRFNNVDIAYNVKIKGQRADVAVVSDRGCDRIRFYKIDPANAAQPLTDITAADVPRVFAERFNQPSALQPEATPGWEANPVDDQNTVYGLTIGQGREDAIFVSQRERGTVKQLKIVADANGRLTYLPVRSFIFNTAFELPGLNGSRYSWTPCREEAGEDPQSEGLVFDAVNNTLYVAFETIGLYQVKLTAGMPSLVNIGKDKLIEPVKTFGQAYTAIPDDDEFECSYTDQASSLEGAINASGSALHAGKNIEADLEGLSIISAAPGQTLMLASSQGDSSFHLYRINQTPTHLGAFLIDGVEETDGVHYVPMPFSADYPLGTLVVQNGHAPEPDDTSDINGYEYDGSTQFKYVSVFDAVKALFSH